MHLDADSTHENTLANENKYGISYCEPYGATPFCSIYATTANCVLYSIYFPCGFPC